MGSKEIWSMFTKNTTFHGVDRAFDQSSSLVKRIIWLFMISGTFIFMLYTLSFGVSKLVHPEYTTQISVTRASSIPFPSVTFCSTNMFRRSYAESDLEVLAYIMATARKNGKYVPENQTLSSLAEAVSLLDVDPQNLTQKVIEASHLQTEVVYNTVAYVTRIWNRGFVPQLTSMGMCYKFNMTQPVREPGSESGLMVYSLVNAHEYFFNPNGLDGIGTKLLPHGPDVYPEVLSRGITAGLGVDTFIGLQKKITYMLPETGCVIEGANKLALYDTYSQSACLNECKIVRQINACGCKFYYDPGNYTLCLTIADFNCLKKLSKIDSYPDCNCPPKCMEETFDTKIFSIPFPSQYTKDFLMRKGNKKLHGNWDNLLRVTVYFETMDVTTVVQKSTYSTDAFFSDVGGLMGLWLGASVITWAELMEVFWDMFTNKGRSKKTDIIKVAPVDMIPDTATAKQIENKNTM